LRARRPNHHDLGISLFVAAALVSAPSAAQDRDPVQRQALLDLAYVLGESHALARACHDDDQYWRARMARLIELEAPDLLFKARLTAQFNTGYSAEEAQFPSCTAQARAAAVDTAKRGRTLSLQLSRIR
jgi:uncharacterized protein (TIGR02301 family)